MEELQVQTAERAPEGVLAKMARVSAEIKIAKNSFNQFGGYAFRNAEQIQGAVKPLLAREGLLLTASDEIIPVADRIYLRATCTVWDPETGGSIEATGWAREQLDKKGMDQAQVTGSASSYARKYALQGLFAIDDGKDDPDAADNRGQGGGHGGQPQQPQQPQQQPQARQELPNGQYTGTLVALQEKTSKSGKNGVQAVFDTAQGRISTWINHGHGNVGRFLESLGYAGYTTEQAAQAAIGRQYTVSKQPSSWNPNFTEVVVLGPADQAANGAAGGLNGFMTDPGMAAMYADMAR